MQPITQRDRRPLFTLVLLALLLSAHPYAWTQYPPPALTGSTFGQNLRNSAAATQNQVTLLRTASVNWCRRAESVNYTDAQFRQDFGSIQWNFEALRAQFNGLGQLALQLGLARANNAVAELEAGLNIIAELFMFLGEEYAAGTLDRTTVLRTARAFQNAIRQWEHEFRKNVSRLGLAW